MKVGEIGNFIKNQSVRKDKVFDFIKQIFLRKFLNYFRHPAQTTKLQIFTLSRDFISFQTTQHQKRIRKEYNRIDSYVFCQHNAR